jgi:peptidoglycan hydrolase-like protein with peptidoglycan-binding domain
LQTRLNDLGYTDAAGNKLKPDSDFGSRTKQAVEQFQRENGLTVTGVADKDTMRLIDKGMTRHAAADGDLKPGEKGPDVRGLQTNLSEMGFKGADGKPLKVDGEYGGNTQAAVSAFQKANGLPETGIADKATLEKVGEKSKVEAKIDAEGTITRVIEPARTTTPQINDTKHPDNKLYQQAVSNLEQMGANGGFKSRDEMERAAGALAADAKLSGLTQIDHVTRSKNGEGLIAVQGADPWASDAKRAFIDTNQAANQPIDQSTKMADSKKPEATVTPQVDTPVETQNKPPKTMAT